MATASEERVRIGTRRVAFARQGSGRPLVLLHGAGGNHHAFDALLPRLVGREAIVPAYPGRLGSDGPPLASVEALAEAVLAFTDALGVERFDLLGHSLGGGVALEIALRPEAAGRLGTLFLLSTGARLRVHPMILELAREAAAAGTTLPVADFAFGPEADPEVVAAANAVARQTPPEAAQADWTAADGFDRMAEVGAVAVPTHVLVGANDRLTPEKYARFLADHVPGARLHVHPSGGHMLAWEDPAWVAAAIGPR